MTAESQRLRIPLAKRTREIFCLFVDVGGVLLTNGWDHHARRRAVKHFKLEGPRWKSGIGLPSRSMKKAS